jgi:hypothetical protein
VVFQVLLVAATHYLVLVLKINKSRKGDGLRKRSGMVANMTYPKWLYLYGRVSIIGPKLLIAVFSGAVVE